LIDLKTDPGRSTRFLLDKYAKPQKGESDTARQYTKRDKRLYERLRYVDYVVDELNIKAYKKQVKYIIKNLENLKDLCKRCKWETIVIAISFYIKCNYHTKCKINHIQRYKICRDNDLNITKYSTIITRLSYKFQTVKALSPLSPIL